MEAHISHLLSLSFTHNPNTGIDWFVLSPILGGKRSAVVTFAEREQAAFAHRDLKIVWELYAKRLVETNEVDLVGLVKGMSEPLGPPEAVCEFTTVTIRHQILMSRRSGYVDPELAAEDYPGLIWGDAYPRLQDLKRKYDP